MSEPALEPDPAENNPVTTGGATGHGFVPGKSGNPGGRPKGLARKVREITGDNDGEAIALFFNAAMHGRMTNPEYDTSKTAAEQPNVKPHIAVGARERLDAAKYLADRGWGKPPQFAPIEDDNPLDYAEREAEEMAASLDARIDELAAKRAERALG